MAPKKDLRTQKLRPTNRNPHGPQRGSHPSLKPLGLLLLLGPLGPSLQVLLFLLLPSRTEILLLGDLGALFLSAGEGGITPLLVFLLLLLPFRLFLLLGPGGRVDIGGQVRAWVGEGVLGATGTATLASVCAGGVGCLTGLELWC